MNLNILFSIFCQVIKQEGGKETETEYFAALMTTLEVTQVVSQLPKTNV